VRRERGKKLHAEKVVEARILRTHKACALPELHLDGVGIAMDLVAFVGSRDFSVIIKIFLQILWLFFNLIKS